jgi:two-component system CheB/CheR fusion protein
LDVRLSPIGTPEGISVLAAVIDVTDRKRLETSLRDQVVQRDSFLATLSHELRNPMAAIVTATSMLSRVVGELPQTAEPCGVIRRQASQIATLLDDLLDVSRVTQNKIVLRREVTDLAALAREAVEAVEPLIAARRHQVRLNAPDEPLWVDVDRARILQVLENLLTNAVKYTPEGGNITLTLSRDGQQSLVRVRDNGRGIAPDLQQSIFDMFVQADTTIDRSQGGMGVGLTLVRSLVELHDGAIDVHSDGVDQGSEFTVRLPATAKRPPRQRPPDVGYVPSPLRVVVVEDCADVRQMLSALLELEGHQVQAAADGRQGLELITTEKPDVALVDIGLPQLDGYQIARRLREHFRKDEICLIALTGYGRAEDHEAVLEAGFDEHLVKPVSTQELNSTLAKAAPHKP